MFPPPSAIAVAQTTTRPVTTNTFEAAVNTYFPGSLPTSQITRMVQQTAMNDLHYTPATTLYATSICPDEINTRPKSLSTTLNQVLTKNQNGVFALGGLAGLPFVGVSGMKACLSHCPLKGDVFVLFGPHVGISESGVIGKIERLGQKPTMSTSCGAALGAYQEIVQQENDDDEHDAPPNKDAAIDFQEDYIISRLRSKLSSGGSSSVLNAESMPTFVTKQMFHLIRGMLMEELTACWTAAGFWDKIERVTLLGGIIINRSASKRSSAEDYFQTLSFDTYSRSTANDATVQKKDWLAIMSSFD
jgi:hypothetical protein